MSEREDNGKGNIPEIIPIVSKSGVERNRPKDTVARDEDDKQRLLSSEKQASLYLLIDNFHYQ